MMKSYFVHPKERKVIGDVLLRSDISPKLFCDSQITKKNIETTPFVYLQSECALHAYIVRRHSDQTNQLDTSSLDSLMVKHSCGINKKKTYF